MNKFIKMFFYPPAPLRVLLILIGLGTLIPVFLTSLKETPIAYIAYGFSAYSLTLLVVWCIDLVQYLKRQKDRLVQENALVGRYVNDHYFHVYVSLCVSVAINLAFAVIKIAGAYLYASLWTGLIAGYYLLLCGLRFYLMRRFVSDGEKNSKQEWKPYRNTAVLLLLLNLALTVVVYKIIWDGNSYTYPGYMIYAYAAYAFYCFGNSAYNVVKYRRLHSPLLSAAKAISMTTALVSVLSLQTAMLTEFGTDGKAYWQLANGLTGTAVCLAVLFISIFMLVQYRRNQEDSL